jgi:hypothetical protein
MFASAIPCVPAVASAQSAPSAPSAPSADSATYELSFVRGGGAEQCPSRRELEREVSLRLGRSPFAAAAPRSIEILMEASAGGFRSVVSVLDRDGKLLGRRALVDETEACAAIFSATALAVALLIDPEALSGEARANVGRFEVEEAANPPPVAPATSALAPPAPPPPERNAAPSVPPMPEPRAVPVAVLGADALVAIGLVPAVSPGVGVSANGVVSGRWGIGVSALYVAKAEVSQGTATLDVSLTTLGAAVTLRAVSSPSLRVTPEVALLAGAHHLAVRGGLAVDSGDQGFWALGAGVRVEAHVTHGLFVGLRAGLVVPLVRRGFAVEGNEGDPIWRAPPVAGMASLGLGWAFF